MSAEAAVLPENRAPDSIDAMNLFVGNLEKSLGKSLAPLEKVGKTMGGSKFGKNAKALGSALKGMGKASVQAWAMEQLMKLIEPFMKLLQLLEIPIGILSMLFTVLVNEIFIQLLPYIIVFSMMLLDLIPVFKWLGQVIGKFVIEGIQKLIEWVKIAIVWIKEFIPIFKNWVKESWESIKQFFVNIWNSFTGFFKDLWQRVKDIAATIGNIWRGIFGADGFFATIIKGGISKVKEIWNNIFGKDGFIAGGLKRLFNIGKNIINGILSAFNDVIIDVNDFLGTKIGTIPLLANGGIATAPTLAMIGERENEVVVPLSRANEFGFGNNAELLSAVEENNRLFRRFIRLQEEDMKMRGMLI